MPPGPGPAPQKQVSIPSNSALAIEKAIDLEKRIF
jgi:hypothetical protein